MELCVNTMLTKIYNSLTTNINHAVNNLKTYFWSYLPETIITYLFLQAVAANQHEEVKILLELGANVNATNKKGDPAIHMACALKTTNILKTLLNNKDIRLDAKNSTGISAIIFSFDTNKAAYRTLRRLQLPNTTIGIENTNNAQPHYTPKPENARKRVSFVLES
jgi:hypothetical protein